MPVSPPIGSPGWRRVGLSAVLVFSSTAAAQSSRMTFSNEVRRPGGEWGSSIDVQPGERVEIRVRATLSSRPANVAGFAGMTFQPILKNWRPDLGDTTVDFPSLCRGRCTEPQPYGRVQPFDSSIMDENSATGVLTGFDDPENILRIAGGNNITATTNLAWGVPVSQVTWVLGGTNFNGSSDIVVFRYFVDIAPQSPPRTLEATTPPAYFNLGRATWFTVQLSGPFFVSIPSQADIIRGTINVIPAPSTLLALAAASALATRRRRPHTAMDTLR